ncbi:AMP-binding protein [Wenzhouxiangella sp. EGI_FJ10305]|uniref:AMP-binding protein n=1 Tax=Wenzhouxiangella sp. EGI_FJ10305 TaxID=3243768 RepID=UPI0035DF5A62
MTTLPLTNRSLNELVMLHEDEPVTVGRFIARAAMLARQLPEGRPVINLCQDRHAFSVTFAAAIMGGGCNLLPANRLKATVDDLVDSFDGAVVVADWELEGFNGTCIDPSRALETQDTARSVPRIPADQPAATVFTSGSTGRASRIEKPWRTLHDSSLINLAQLDPPPGARVLATVPPQHMWGLETSVLMPWFGPVTVVSAHPFFVADICRQLERIEQPRVLVSTPVHLRALVESGIDLPTIERVYSATAPLSRSLARRIERINGAKVVEIYGCSETGCLARRQTARVEDWQLFEAFELTPDGDGTVARAPHLPGPVRLMDHLEFRTRDSFRLLGRQSDLVNIAGKRASLAELTGILLDIPGVLDGVIFQPPETDDAPATRLAALVVAPNLETADIRRALGRRVDAAFMPRPLRLVDRLPRAETGKLPRQSLLQFFAKTCREAG